MIDTERTACSRIEEEAVTDQQVVPFCTEPRRKQVKNQKKTIKPKHKTWKIVNS
jgi:hypothetical protein